jgi:hypothetical protein
MSLVKLVAPVVRGSSLERTGPRAMTLTSVQLKTSVVTDVRIPMAVSTACVPVVYSLDRIVVHALVVQLAMVDVANCVLLVMMDTNVAVGMVTLWDLMVLTASLMMLQGCYFRWLNSETQ